MKGCGIKSSNYFLPDCVFRKIAPSLNSGNEVSKGKLQEVLALLQLLSSTRWLSMLSPVETQSNLFAWIFDVFVCLFVCCLYFLFVCSGDFLFGGLVFDSFSFWGGQGEEWEFLSCFYVTGTWQPIFAIWTPLSVTPQWIYFLNFSLHSTRLFNPHNPCSAVRMTAVKSETCPLLKWSGKPTRWIGHTSLWPKGTIDQFLNDINLICFSFEVFPWTFLVLRQIGKHSCVDGIFGFLK